MVQAVLRRINLPLYDSVARHEAIEKLVVRCEMTACKSVGIGAFGMIAGMEAS